MEAGAMRIHALFVTRTYEKTSLELVDAWDEYAVDQNAEGFEEAKKKAATDDECTPSPRSCST
jgi:hypothetical protein